MWAGTVNATFVITRKSDELVGHEWDFFVQVLAPVMQFEEIAPIDAMYMSKIRNAPAGTWVLGGGIEIPCIYQIYGCKKKK